MADMLGWRWEFGVQVAPLFLFTGMAIAVIPHDLGLQGKRENVWEALGAFDYRGSILLTAGITFFVLGLVSRILPPRVVIADLFLKKRILVETFSLVSLPAGRAPQSVYPLVTKTI